VVPGVPVIVSLSEETVGVDEALLVGDVELVGAAELVDPTALVGATEVVEATALVGATDVVEACALVGAAELVEPTELVGSAELTESTGVVEPAGLAVSAVASAADESEDPPHPAIIPETNTSAQQAVLRQDFRLNIFRTPELNRTRPGRQRCAKEADALTRCTPLGAARQ
jgi:carbonic anhydrase/acetyltransferase-like protein (isoleucine patch superfamily)